MEIKDNELLRQFEASTEFGTLIIEYAMQERKLFLTKLNVPSDLDPEIQDEFLKNILETAQERKLKVVPTHPKIVSFFRKNKKYSELLPPGIRI